MSRCKYSQIQKFENRKSDLCICSCSDLGVHVDGFIANVAHTVVATNDPQQAITGRKADVICAAHFAGEIALRLLRPGNTVSIHFTLSGLRAQIIRATTFLLGLLYRLIIEHSNLGGHWTGCCFF